jgi:ribosomal protein S18 acetylase RimI-like enzyme
VPLLRDPVLVRPFLSRHLPRSQTAYNIVFGIGSRRARWVRINDPTDPHAVLVRSRRFVLFADCRRAAAQVLAEVPRNLRLVFGATPMRYYRLIKRCWRGPDAGERAGINACCLYYLKPGRFFDCRGHRISRLVRSDAPAITAQWQYGRDPDHVRRLISTMPGCGIRRGRRLVAWGLLHDDGSMGFLHVLEEYRGQGMARAVTAALTRSVLRLGLQPFLYIVKTNRASIRLTESMGFTRGGEYGWFGTVR